MKNSRGVVEVDLGDRSYNIIIEAGALRAPASFAALPKASQAILITNSTVHAHYGSDALESIQRIYPDVKVIQLPDGESHKEWASLDFIFQQLLGWKVDRKAIIFGLGGGVIGDISGFAAACYMRGIAFVQIPTTLLAQVDSSVGGKTAINHPLGKNMIGAFYQPLRVIADLDTLDTLPDRELSAGLAEVIKYGPIADNDFFVWLEANLDALWAKDKAALAHAVMRSCEIKADVVGKDEKEFGLRAILNFGHTFGHAIEAGLGYGEWLHGEAVGCGMVMAIDLSQRLGLVDDDYAARVVRLIQRAQLPIRGPRLGIERYLELMQIDKKTEHGELRFVVIEKPGRAQVRSIPEHLVREVLEANCG